MITKQLIDRINELSRKKKEVGLTDEELAEQAKLRRQYIDGVKSRIDAQLDNVYIKEPDGTIHPAKRPLQ